MFFDNCYIDAIHGYPLNEEQGIANFLDLYVFYISILYRHWLPKLIGTPDSRMSDARNWWTASTWGHSWRWIHCIFFGGGGWIVNICTPQTWSALKVTYLQKKRDSDSTPAILCAFGLPLQASKIWHHRLKHKATPCHLSWLIHWNF